MELDKLKKCKEKHELEEFGVSGGFLVTNIKRINVNTLEITAIINVYLNNGELYLTTSNIIVELVK